MSTSTSSYRGTRHPLHQLFSNSPTTSVVVDSLVTPFSLVAEAGTGLDFFHGHNYVHNDVKAANILVFPKEEGKEEDHTVGTAKMADFGLALGERIENRESRTEIEIEIEVEIDLTCGGCVMLYS